MIDNTKDRIRKGTNSEIETLGTLGSKEITGETITRRKVLINTNHSIVIRIGQEIEGDAITKSVKSGIEIIGKRRDIDRNKDKNLERFTNKKIGTTNIKKILLTTSRDTPTTTLIREIQTGGQGITKMCTEGNIYKIEKAFTISTQTNTETTITKDMIEK